MPEQQNLPDFPVKWSFVDVFERYSLVAGAVFFVCFLWFQLILTGSPSGS